MSTDVVLKYEKLHSLCMHQKSVNQRRNRGTIHLWKMRSEGVGGGEEEERVVIRDAASLSAPDSFCFRDKQQ